MNGKEKSILTIKGQEPHEQKLILNISSKEVERRILKSPSGAPLIFTDKDKLICVNLGNCLWYTVEEFGREI